ncbi:hypothetical protein ACT5YR_07725 [Fructobacillus fructosus]|uniref:Uncharacterized protein n=1 Tax=Fructobacillus fructosus TaxID=1631 RepID=A0ABM9MZE2_9LACO|nr:unnamed protein product [Fructobacillus fructosus]
MNKPKETNPMWVYASTKGARYIIRSYNLGQYTVEEESTGQVEKMATYQLLEFIKIFKLKRVK